MLNQLLSKIMSNKIFTLYQTNERNVLGGFMTYGTLSDAFDSLCPKSGINTITAITKVDASYWHGKKMPYLCEVLSSGVIYRS